MNIALRYIFILLCLIVPIGASAQKTDSKKKVHKAEIVADDFEPDPIAHKAKPDHHPRPLPLPHLYVDHDNDRVHVHGIDVSHYQGKVNWDEAAKDEKVGYVYLKATEGTRNVDDTYRHNFSECKRVGLKVGSYLFFRPQLSPREQFELFRKTVDTRQQDLLPLVDAESLKGVSVNVFQQRLLELCELLEKEYGTKPLIYTGQNFYNKHIHSNSRLRSYKFFIAKYDEEPPLLDGGDDYVMWQYTARGKVKGIRGFVDQSHFVGSHSLKEIIYKKH